MNLKKIFSWTSIIVGIIFLLLLLFFFINVKYVKCHQTHELNNGMCFYHNDTCSAGQAKTVLNNEEVCTYKPLTFLSNKSLIIILVISAVVWFIIFIIFIINKILSSSNLSFKKDNYIPPKEAKELFALRQSKLLHIPMIDGKPSEDYFIFDDSEPFTKGSEKFLKIQCEITAGDKPGIYTTILNLSKGKDAILNDDYRIKRILYDDYKIRRDMPLNVPEDAQERMLEKLEMINPDKAFEKRQELIERQINTPQSQNQEQPPQQNIIIRRSQPYRRPYRRYI